MVTRAPAPEEQEPEFDEYDPGDGPEFTYDGEPWHDKNGEGTTGLTDSN